MIAAARAARKEAPPPPLLQYAWRAKRWGTLPEAGGLRDQPAGMLDKMAYLADVYAAEQGYRNAKNAANWAGDNPQAHEIIGNVRRLERELKWRVKS